MSGHSKWANIKHKKGIADAKKGVVFTKIARELTVAARQGSSGDPAENPKLRLAMDKARQANMPSDNMDRAIKKGLGTGEDDTNLEETLYEGYSPGGAAILLHALTDNRNRTAGEIRKAFEVYGGNLGSTGCVAWMFQRRGLFTIRKEGTDEDRIFEIALEAGADDVEELEEMFQVISAVDTFQSVSDAFVEAGIDTEVAEIAQVAASTVELDVSNGRRVLNLLETLEDQDDVQTVTANFSLSDEVLAEVTG